ncbi:MAG: DUF4347 domain-containing protein, partial [Cyanobacteria bacterium P01_F01_bin.153]
MFSAVPSGRQIAFIDPNLEAWEVLASGVKDGVEVMLLDPAQDAIAQITQVLSQRPNPQTIHLVSHGAPGTLFLGPTAVDIGNLDRYRDSLEAWVGLDVLLYGCRVAAGVIGQQFVQRFQQLTGGRVFASNSLVGTCHLGGRWDLRAIATNPAPLPSLAFSPAATQTYPAILASFAAATNFAVGNAPRGIAAGDFNGDNNLDLVIADASDNDASILLGNGARGFATFTDVPDGGISSSVAVGLFNGDTNLDFVVANRFPLNASLLTGDGAGGFAAPADSAVGSGASSVAVGDFNGDTNL